MYDNMILLYGVFVAFVIIFMIGFSIYVKYKNAKIRESITSGKLIYYKDFEDNWISIRNGKKGLVGYKYNDTSGCYVIMIFDHLVRNNKFNNYENIYIGQSVNVCQRVHNHFNGKGKGDVYADIKYGKEAYVRIVPCHKKDMNSLEKELIKAFNATNSYNSTKGGSKIR